MNWRFVGYALAGYLTAWFLVVYVATATTLVQPVDWRPVIATALLLTPFGAVFGVLAEEMRR